MAGYNAASELAALVAARVKHARTGTSGARPLVRVSVPAGSVEPLEWLSSQRSFPRVFWQGRGETGATAALGAAALVRGRAGEMPGAALEPLLALLRDAGEPRGRIYGGAPFDPAADPAGDAAASSSCFVLPRIELVTGSGGAELACNLILPRDLAAADDIVRQIRQLDEPASLQPAAPLPLVRTRRDLPTRPDWSAAVRFALREIEAGRLGKVVLARRATLSASAPLDPFALLGKLRETTPGCFHFCFQPHAGTAFLGASPERLFRRDGREIRSEAVAGTRPRGSSDADDERLSAELRASDKEQREHDFVRASIRAAIEPLCTRLEVAADAGEMILAQGRHLVSAVRGTLRPGVSDPELLAALHPTPAVAGHPTEDALATIRQLEPFHRGWYAGPVGWLGGDSAEFAVGIRSAVVRSGSISLYSGAGIVRGSEPDAEWAEIEHKITDFLTVFGHDR